jgi:hypothetical protein
MSFLLFTLGSFILPYFLIKTCSWVARIAYILKVDEIMGANFLSLQQDYLSLSKSRNKWVVWEKYLTLNSVILLLLAGCQFGSWKWSGKKNFSFTSCAIKIIGGKITRPNFFIG